ncbi:MULTISPECIES: RICIN domain-containing protein [unclassified Microbacterium]|uniref:RICIN domain-containing protein n=1 Tax=unclassified Microbacterium TaxID=2609290 RepID=UPI00160530D1|nr:MULTISPECIES: RICIN domain-containing protein [unclassified Microbacterium]QNA91289.1 RICIN domain-containing protein [Microbacterium sp. Se63.02b]QYM64439.1 RICIN domain-containing protein [Microbacterium sp. Se5.02b]
MGKSFARKRARKAAVGAVVGALIVAGLASLGGAAEAAVSPDVPPMLQRDSNVVSADPIPTVQIDNGYVWAQTTIGSTVYAVGKFDNAREPKAAPGTALTARSNVLAYDINTGALLPFAPKVNGVIKAVAASPDGTRIYIGGSFNSVNGQERNNFAAINAQTGELVPGVVPSIGGSGVYALTTAGSTVYAGGLFTQANGVARKNLAAFDASTGAVLSWAPQPDQQVDAMVIDPAGTNAIVGGRFTHVNGSEVVGSAAVNMSTGALDTSWLLSKTVKGINLTTGIGGIFSLATDATGVYGTGWGNSIFEGTFAAEPGTGAIRWVADCHGDHYGVYSTGKVVYTTSHMHACATMGQFTETTPHVNQYAEAYTADARGTLSHNQVAGYTDWAGNPAPSAYQWAPDWAVGTTSGLGQAGLSITGTGNMISIGGEFRSVNNGQFEGLVRFSTTPPGGAKQGPRVSGADWTGTAVRPDANVDSTTVTIPANWDRDDLGLYYELYRAGGTTPVATAAASTTRWNRPNIQLVDSTSSGHQQLSYTVVAKDGNGNTATSAVINGPAPYTGPDPVQQTSREVLIVSSVSGKAMGAVGNDLPPVTQPVTQDRTQQWWVLPQANGTVQVRNAYYGTRGGCLGVSGASVDDGAPIVTTACTNLSSTLWNVRDLGNGHSQLVAAHSGKCLALENGNIADGTKFVQAACDAPNSNSSVDLRNLVL